MVFTAVLSESAAIAPGYSFQINVVGTDSGQTDFAFCGPVPACASGRDYRQALGVPPAPDVAYKFERASPAGDIFVFGQGTVRLDHDQTVRATYSG